MHSEHRFVCVLIEKILDVDERRFNHTRYGNFGGVMFKAMRGGEGACCRIGLSGDR